MSNDVVHAPEQSRFQAGGGEEPAVLLYEREEGRVRLLHTIVPDDLEGQGVGSALAGTAIAWARQEGLEVVPVCTFVQGWLERHPEALTG